jgi:nitrogen fixation/metabolism regulation signal transduction histidine kinase
LLIGPAAAGDTESHHERHGSHARSRHSGADLAYSNRTAAFGQYRRPFTDSGVGVDPQHLSRIFEVFYTTKAQGIGMGLTIRPSITETHGGRL